MNEEGKKTIFKIENLLETALQEIGKIKAREKKPQPLPDWFEGFTEKTYADYTIKYHGADARIVPAEDIWKLERHNGESHGTFQGLKCTMMGDRGFTVFYNPKPATAVTADIKPGAVFELVEDKTTYIVILVEKGLYAIINPATGHRWDAPGGLAATLNNLTQIPGMFKPRPDLRVAIVRHTEQEWQEKVKNFLKGNWLDAERFFKDFMEEK